MVSLIFSFFFLSHSHMICQHILLIVLSRQFQNLANSLYLHCCHPSLTRIMISPFLFLVSPHFLLKRDTRVIMSKSKSNASSLFKTLHGVSHLLSVKARVLKRPSKAHCDLLLSHGLFDFTFCSPHASCLCSTTLLSL